MSNTPLLILHGALGAAAQMQQLVPFLEADFSTHTLDFHGHGGVAPITDQFNIAGFGQQVLRFLDQHQLNTVNIFGYSMGGYVATWLAIHHPTKVEKVMTLATKWDWNPEGAAKEVKMLNPKVIAKKVPHFAKALADRHHPESWEQQMELTAQMMLNMGNQPPVTPEGLTAVKHPYQLLLGDSDKMVSQEETIATRNHLAKAEFKLLENTPHPFEKVNLEQLANEIKAFFA
ncbi:MAG: alpha/beta fold hydrolase [Bacteroidota bacterium]